MAVRVGQGPGSGSLTDAAALGLPQGQRKREAGPAPHLQAGGPGFPRPLPAAPHERSGGGPREDTSKRPQPSSETGQTHGKGGTQARRTEPVSLTAKRRAIKATGGAGALTRFFCVKPEGQATSSGSFHGCLRHGHECVGSQGAGDPTVPRLPSEVPGIPRHPQECPIQVTMVRPLCGLARVTRATGGGGGY